MSDRLGFLKNSDRLLNPGNENLRLNNDDIDSILIQTNEVNLENLNSLFEAFQSTVDVLSLSVLQDENDQTDGLILHYLEVDRTLKLQAFQRSNDDGRFMELELPASSVVSFSLNNVLYVARNYFPNRNIFTLGVSALGEIESRNRYDDISLIRFMSKYKMPKQNTNSKSYRTTIIEPVSYSEPCAVAVHHCNNAEDGSNCQPFGGGCYPQPEGCGYMYVQAQYQERQMSTELNSYLSYLPSEYVYNVKDWLITQPSGEFYSDAYYAMSEHFAATLDIELLYDITVAAPDLGLFVNAIANGNDGYILSESSFQKLAEVAQTSAQKSDSYAYKDFINTIVLDAQKYKAKNVKEIEGELSKEIIFE